MPIRTPPPGAGIYGQGVSYPMTLDSNGRLKLSYGPQIVSEAVLSIAQTQTGERPMQPDYGANNALFDEVDLAAYKISLEQGIAEHEPRVERANVSAALQPDGGVRVTIAYLIRGEADERTLTYPLFLGPART